MALCTITGFVYMPNGQPARSRLFRFKPANTVITADDGGIIIPEVVDAATNRAGFLEVTLATGSYTASSTLYNGGIVVPDAETATLYEVFGGVGPVDPPADVAPNFTTLPTLLGSTSLGGTITVNLGAASGSPAPVITGMLTRPGASPVTVTQGQRITVQAGDQGGALSLTATATNRAGVDTETVQRAIPAAIPAPVLTAPLPDRSLTVGDAAVTLALGDFFANAASYSVSPTGQGVSISGSTLTISAATERNATYTVTASNSTGQTVSDAFALVVAAAVTAPSYQRMVVIGASQETDLFGGPSSTATQTAVSNEMGLPVYVLAVRGVGINTGAGSGRAQIADALTRWPTPGETLFLIGSIAGNDITAVIEGGLSDAEADAIATAYNSMLDLFGAHLPHVHALQTSFRSYTNHGFSGSQLFDNPDLGSANLNERLTPIFQSRLNQSLYYANGDSMVDWYDLTRNNYATWIRDGIHHTTALLPTIRQTLTSRLRAALDGTPPAAVVPAARPALAALIATASAPNATVGTAYSYAAGRLFNLWDAPYTVSGLPAWATLTRNDLGQFTITGTPTAAASLSVVVTATIGGVSRTSTISLSVAAAGSTAGPLSIVNFTSPLYDATFQAPYNNVDSDAAAVSLANILDVSGAGTGIGLTVSFTGSPVVSSTTPPGRGRNNGGRVTGLSAYNGNLLSSNITRGNLFITSGVTAPMVLSGLTPGASYEIGFVGTRVAADVRNTSLTVGALETIWNAAEDPPVERKVTRQAAADGTISLLLATSGGAAYAYLGGFSIQRLA